MPALAVLAHHSEPSDPLLLRWVLDTFESIFGLTPTAVVLPTVGAMIVLPTLLAFFALRARRQARGVSVPAVDTDAETDAGSNGRLAK